MSFSIFYFLTVFEFLVMNLFLTVLFLMRNPHVTCEVYIFTGCDVVGDNCQQFVGYVLLLLLFVSIGFSLVQNNH